MAETTARTTEFVDPTPDLTGVRSRISWGAILAGAAVALAAYLLLTFLFAGVGLSLTEAGVRANAVGIGALVAAVVSIALSLFLGGWTAAQLTAGETKQEAVLYGVIVWAVVTAMTLALVGMGVRAGYFAVISGTVIAQNSEQLPNWEEAARRAGVSQERIDAAKQGVDTDRARAAATDPANRQAALDASTSAAWGAFAGTAMSIGMAVWGAVAGCGRFRMFPVAVAPRRVVIAGGTV